jgi:hypothetical protein
MNSSARFILLCLVSAAIPTATHAEPIALSPSIAASMPNGPVPGTKITEAYARLIARDAYLATREHGQSPGGIY